MKNSFTDSITSIGIDDAITKIGKKYSYRIVEENGVKIVTTRDYNLSRVNLSILNKVVVNAYLG